MRKHCSNVCKFRPCLATESTNLAPMLTIVTAVLLRQCSQTELIFWITLVYGELVGIQKLALNVCEFSAVRQSDQPPRISQTVPKRWWDVGGYKLLGPSGQGTDCVVYVFVFLDGIIVF
jgi:hypothetical protein